MKAWHLLMLVRCRLLTRSLLCSKVGVEVKDGILYNYAVSTKTKLNVSYRACYEYSYQIILQWK